VGSTINIGAARISQPSAYQLCATTGLASPEHRSIRFRGADFALSGAVIFVV
jgi:hypothetical protein